MAKETLLHTKIYALRFENLCRLCDFPYCSGTVRGMQHKTRISGLKSLEGQSPQCFCPADTETHLSLMDNPNEDGIENLAFLLIPRKVPRPLVLDCKKAVPR